MKNKLKSITAKGKYLIFLTAVVFLISVNFVNALASYKLNDLQDQEVKAAVTVGAIVPSDVSEVNSSIWTNVDEALADLEQGIIVTVELRDDADLPLPDLPVTLSSNRGAVDNIIVINAQNEPTGEAFATTNADGRVYFRVTSSVPGKATLTALADNLITLPADTSVEVTFLPLPFPENITIAIRVPSIIREDGKITIFEPKKKESSIDREKLVNLGAELIIPFWVLVVILILGSISPILLIIVMMLLRRIRKLNTKELETIEKEEAVIEKEEKVIEKEEKLLEEIDKKTKSS